jgi:hypothetical protein
MEYKGKKHERKQTFQMAYIIGGKNNISNRERRIRSRNCKRGRKKNKFSHRAREEETKNKQRAAEKTRLNMGANNQRNDKKDKIMRKNQSGEANNRRRKIANFLFLRFTKDWYEGPDLNDAA